MARHKWIGVLLLVVIALASVARAGGGVAHVERMGAGPRDMILIPGMSTDWTIWRDFMERHKSDFTMYAVTLAGFGGTDAPDGLELSPAAAGTPLIDHAVAAVVDLADQQALENPIVMGLGSLGGYVAVRVAAAGGDAIGPVIVVDGFLPSMPLGASGVITDPEQRREMVETLLPHFVSLGAEDWDPSQGVRFAIIDQDRATELQAMMQRTSHDVSVAYLSEVFQTDVSEALGQVDETGFAIFALGADSGPAFMDPTRKISKRQSAGILRDQFNFQAAFFMNSRRFVMHDHPEAFDEAIDRFLKGLPVSDYVPPAPVAPPKGDAPE